MNDIGFGIMCFGDDYYYRGALEKILQIRSMGYTSYILTDDIDKFTETPFIDVEYLYYYRSVKSYHDKMWLVKEILKSHDIAILLDADTHITDYSFLNGLKTHKFKEGISYADILLNHPEKKQFVKDIDMSKQEWRYYHDFAKNLLIDFQNLELIWEYFLVVNSKGFNFEQFHPLYEKLQIAKEFGDIRSKDVIGCGEGISVSIASKLSQTPCQRDYELYDVIKNKMTSVSRNFTPKEKWPEWMK